jgi:hypothetical protein
MSQRDDTGFKSFPAGEVMEANSRVILNSSGVLMYADLVHRSLGTIDQAALAVGQIMRVKLRSAAGTHKVRCKEALAIGALIYSEADGEVQDTAEATGFVEGTALEAATAENDIVEFLYNNAGDTAAT